MASSKTSPYVLIIGAGLGGMALAQALRKKEISFDLFEREHDQSARFQGWAIALHPWFMKEISSATMDDLPELETVGVGYEINLPAEGAIYDATNMTEITRFGNGRGPDFIRADRAKLREWLMTNINLHWGKRFTHYEEDGNRVTAFFDDGTSYSGDILVGADGINSHVRDQLLPNPDQRPKSLSLGIIVGELKANEEQFTRWRRLGNSFFIGYAPQRRLFVGLKNVAADGRGATYYWIFGWTDKEATKEDYWTTTASQAELHKFVMEYLDGVRPEFADVFRATQVDGILLPPLKMRDMTPVELPKGQITLLGDAIHPMVPFRGQGGNMAMKDGITLASRIETGGAISIEDMLKKYEAEMIPRTTKTVLESRAGDPGEQGGDTYAKDNERGGVRQIGHS